MKKILLALLCALGVPWTATAQQARTVGQISGNTSVVLDVSGMGTAVIVVSGTYSGTLNFEVVGVPGAAAVTVDCATPDAPATAVNSTTSTGTWTCPVAAMSTLQVRMSSYGSGTATVGLGAVATGGGSGGGGAGGGDATASNQDEQTVVMEAVRDRLDTLLVRLPGDATQGGDVLSTFPQLGGEAKDFDGSALPNNVAEGKTLRAAFTPYGHLFTFATNEDGSKEVGVTEDTDHANADYGQKVWARRIDTLATSASASGKYGTFNQNSRGALWVSSDDPCDSEAKTTAPFSLTARGVVIAAVSAKKNFVCSIVVVAGAAEVFNLVEGTGTTCQTSTAAVAGSTTAANGLSFAANGGFSAIGGRGTVIAGIGTNVDTCIMPSGSNRLSGFITYVQRAP